jgi:hypothetical protein
VGESVSQFVIRGDELVRPLEGIRRVPEVALVVAQSSDRERHANHGRRIFFQPRQELMVKLQSQVRFSVAGREGGEPFQSADVPRHSLD